MNLRFIDWIWHVRGSLAVAPGHSSDDIFTRLDPLFGEPGTRHDGPVDTLRFRKKNAAAQDKMSVFDRGVLNIETGRAGLVLRYDLTSYALLSCFVAPLLFLAVAQLTVTVAAHQKRSEAAAEKSGKISAAAKKRAEAKKNAAVPFNAIDKALGAPAPEKPKKKSDKADDDEKFLKPTSAYVLAGIFAALYAIGRILEDRLVRALFRKRLALT